MWHTLEGAPEGATFRAMAPGDQVARSRFRAGFPAIHARAISRPNPAAMTPNFAATDIAPIIALINSGLQDWYTPIMADDDERLRIWLEEPEIDDEEMRHRKFELACMHGAMSVSELRRYVGLPEDRQFSGLLVGGRDMGGSGTVERGIHEMIEHAQARHEADVIVAGAKAVGLYPSDRLPSPNSRK